MKKGRGPCTYTQLQQGEQMKSIEGFPYYYVTNFGRILSTKPLGAFSRVETSLREVTQSYGGEKYYYANIYNDKGVRCSLRVHRLVYQYFNTIGDVLKEGFVVDHKDENKLHNHIDNLQQITQRENLRKHHNIKRIITNA